MSNPGLSKLQNLSLTGNPTVDAVIRYGLVGLCTGISGAILGWLNSHGFHDPNLTIYVPMGVATALIAIAMTAWGIVRTSKNELLIQLREAIAVKAGIAAAEAPAPTPQIASVSDAKAVIAEHAPDASNIEKK